MEFRSTNPEGFVHFGGDVMSGAQSTRGILLSSNSIKSVSDNSNEDMNILPKGNGFLVLGTANNAVIIGGSTTPYKLVAGESTTTVPNMPANSLALSTMAAAGISTADLIITTDPRNSLSTGVTLSRAYPSAANEISLVWINPHASSIAAESTGITIRWAYLDRT